MSSGTTFPRRLSRTVGSRRSGSCCISARILRFIWARPDTFGAVSPARLSRQARCRSASSPKGPPSDTGWLPAGPGALDGAAADARELRDFFSDSQAFPHGHLKTTAAIDACMPGDLDRFGDRDRDGTRDERGRRVLEERAHAIDARQHGEPRGAVAFGTTVPLVPDERLGDTQRIPAGKPCAPAQIEVLEVH